MNLIPCKLIAVPYSPKQRAIGDILLGKQGDNFIAHVISQKDINDNKEEWVHLQPVQLYLTISQPLKDYYFRDYYIEKVFPPNRPVVRRVTQEVINHWLYSKVPNFEEKYFKVIAKPEVIGAIYLKSKKGDGGKILTDYSIMTNKYIEQILNNNGDCFTQVKYPVRDHEAYILCFIKDKVIIHLNNNPEK